MYTRRGKKESYINDDFPDKLGYFGVISIIDSCHRRIGNLRSSFWSTLSILLLLFCQINSDVVSALPENGDQTKCIIYMHTVRDSLFENRLLFILSRNP